MSDETFERICDAEEALSASGDQLNAGQQHSAASLGGLNQAYANIQDRIVPGDRQLLIDAGAIIPSRLRGGRDTFHQPRFGEAIQDLRAKARTEESFTPTDRAFARHLSVKMATRRIDMIRDEWTATLESVASRYDSSNNGKYPVRDVHGQRIRVTQMAKRSENSFSRTTYVNTQVRPYVDSRMSEEARAALYDKMICQPFLAQHVQRPAEVKMIGQNAVFAGRPIKRGECLGVYGGTLIEDDLRTTLLSDTYTFALTAIPSKAANGPIMDGDNILSRMNSTFDEENGKPYRHAIDSYNVELTVFEVNFEQRGPGVLPVFFATCDLAEGTELRWDYGYSREDIARKIAARVSVQGST